MTRLFIFAAGLLAFLAAPAEAQVVIYTGRATATQMGAGATHSGASQAYLISGNLLSEGALFITAPDGTKTYHVFRLANALRTPVRLPGGKPSLQITAGVMSNLSELKTSGKAYAMEGLHLAGTPKKEKIWGTTVRAPRVLNGSAISVRGLPDGSAAMFEMTLALVLSTQLSEEIASWNGIEESIAALEQRLQAEGFAAAEQPQ
jgi:hypothetical protein